MEMYILYWQQCDAPEEVSQDTNTASMCTECCTGNLCNSAGCQFKGDDII
jgi:hypothetical protein